MDYTERTTTHDYSGLKTVAALFHDRAQAQAAIEDLKASGFDEGHIGIAMRDRDEAGQLAEETGTGSLVVENGATGAVSGGLVGSVIGLIVGIGLAHDPRRRPRDRGRRPRRDPRGRGHRRGGRRPDRRAYRTRPAPRPRGALRGGLPERRRARDREQHADDDRALAVFQRHGGDLGPTYIGDVHPLDEEHAAVATPSGIDNQSKTDPT
jgi:hypothetical protein